MRIGWLSDMDFRASGYFNISIATCSRLVERGHDVKVIGFGYKGQEHNYNFGIIPSNNLMECSAIAQNLGELWGMDLLIVALDISVQEQFIRQMKNRKFKYAGIFPVEAPPLCMTWAMVLMSMDKQFIISEFGTEEAHKVGIPAVHFPVGIDTEAWRIPTPEERDVIRTNYLGIDKDCFVILTVADNQERKNLSASIEAFSGFVQSVPNARYILVTREHNLVGWRIRDFAAEMDNTDLHPSHKVSISDKLMLFERGIDFKELWSIYASADVFVLPSKAEGRGLPLLEAMSVGIPCIGTNCTGIKESLDGGRGILVDYDYTHRDPFGNGYRYWISRTGLADALALVYEDKESDEMKSMVYTARKYVETLDWDKSVDILCDNIKEYERKNEEQK